MIMSTTIRLASEMTVVCLQFNRHQKPSMSYWVVSQTQSLYTRVALLCNSVYIYIYLNMSYRYV